MDGRTPLLRHPPELAMDAAVVDLHDECPERRIKLGQA
jgi:hypothetical protein